MRKRLFYVLSGVGAVALLAGAFYGGFWLGGNGGTIAESAEGEVPAEIGSQIPLDADVSLLWDTIGFIKNRYFKPEDVDDRKLLYGAISGAVDSLNDPYSQFFPPDDAEKFEEDLSGNFYGIGAEIGIRDGQLVIVSPLEGNPADKAGIRAGDRILKVDDTLTADLSLNEAVKLIRGELGTDVILLIDRDGWEEPRRITVTRAEITIPTIDWEMKEDDVAYIHLYNFNANAPQAFYKASFDLLMQGSRGLVLDLRGNSGGYLEVANNIAGWFLKRGSLIVTERFPNGEDRRFHANGGGAWGRTPVVLLVDGSSASASEIVAGALRDQLGVTIVGEKTFGKGTVQEMETLSDGSKVKISVAEWVTPEGYTINESGIEPDVKVPVTAEDIEAGNDPQLEKAVEILKEQAKDVEVIQTIVL
mgnify:CR=1 FL=1